MAEAGSRSDRTKGYASALLAVANAEGDAERIGGELSAVARALDSSADLSETLADRQIPMERKQAILEELIGSRTSAATLSLVLMLVSSGRIDEFSDIVARMKELSAESGDTAVAEIRTAAPLDEATLQRLVDKLADTTGRRVRPEVVVDPELLGGVVVTLGDTVFDGSARSRLQELREVWG